MSGDLEKEYEAALKAESIKNNKKAQVEDIIDVAPILGFVTFDMEKLPSKGRFYPVDLKIGIRAATVGEIRDFSLINEQSFQDIDDKLNAICKACINLTTNSGFVYKDLIEEDRFVLLLEIRGLTFPEPEEKIMIPVPNSNEQVELSYNNLKTFELPEYISSKFDAESKRYVFNLKSGSTYSMAPPTIGTMSAINEYIVNQTQSQKQFDKGSLQILPYLTDNWRNLTDKNIKKFGIDMLSMKAKDAAVVLKIAEDMKIGVMPELSYISAEGEETLVPLTFPGGLKSLFSIQDITSEIL